MRTPYTWKICGTAGFISLMTSCLVSARNRCMSPTRQPRHYTRKTESPCMTSLKPNAVMRRNDHLCSQNAFYRAYLDAKGTFVVKNKNQMVIFSSGRQGDRLEFREYGNLELFDNNTLKWVSNTYGKMADLTLTDSGWLTIHDHEGNVRWKSHQCTPIGAEIQTWCNLPYATAWYPNLLLRATESLTRGDIPKLRLAIHSMSRSSGNNKTACWLLFQPCIDGVPILLCDDMCRKYKDYYQSIAALIFGKSWLFRQTSCVIFPDGLGLEVCSKIDETGYISYHKQNGTKKQTKVMVNESWTKEYDWDNIYVRPGLYYGLIMGRLPNFSLSRCLRTCKENPNCKGLAYTFNGNTCWLRYKDYQQTFMPVSNMFNLVVTYNRVCLSNACKNGGTCHTTEKGFACECSRGYFGKVCDACAIPVVDLNAEYSRVTNNTRLFSSYRVPENVMVRISCKPGYHIGKVNFSSQCYCGKWTPSLPICEPDKTNPLLEALLGSTSGIFVLVVLCFLMWIRFRDALQVLVYDYFGWRVRRDRVDQEDRLFDVFIAYSNSNSHFANKVLLPALEERGFKTCVHQRDFEIGAAVSDNIVNAVLNSKRIIVLLSPDFIGSEWCMFEFQQAVFQAVHERNSQVIMIMYEPVDLSKIHQDDHTLKMYIQTHTYLERNDPLFWKRLFYALPNKPNMATNTLLTEETVDL